MNPKFIGVQTEPDYKLSPAVVEVLLQWGNQQHLANQAADGESLVPRANDEPKNVIWDF
jgi:hypothetical protein